MKNLINKQCRPISMAEGSLQLVDIKELLNQTPEWSYCETSKTLMRCINFANFKRTMRAVNAVAEIAEAQDHHPKMVLNYGQCQISYNTHTVNGVTENDFICAALIDEKLLQVGESS